MVDSLWYMREISPPDSINQATIVPPASGARCASLERSITSSRKQNDRHHQHVIVETCTIRQMLPLAMPNLNARRFAIRVSSREGSIPQWMSDAPVNPPDPTPTSRLFPAGGSAERSIRCCARYCRVHQTTGYNLRHSPQRHRCDWIMEQFSGVVPTGSSSCP